MSLSRPVRKASIVSGRWRPRDSTVGLVLRAWGTVRRRSPSTSRMRLPKRSRRCSNSFFAWSTRCSTCRRVLSTWLRTSSLPHPVRANARTSARVGRSRRRATDGGLPRVAPARVVVAPLALAVALPERLQRLLDRLGAATHLRRQRRLARPHALLGLLHEALRPLPEPAALIWHRAPPGRSL